MSSDDSWDVMSAFTTKKKDNLNVHKTVLYREKFS